MPRVIIVGAGPVGVLCARLMAAAGCEVSIIDNSTKGAAGSSSSTKAPALNADAVLANPRAYALSPASVKLLDKAGIWSDIITSKPCPYRGMYVWDQNGIARVQFAAEDAGLVQLGFIVQHDILMRCLLGDLEKHKVKLIQGAAPESYNRASASASLRLTTGEQLDADLVIGADGGASQVRELAGIIAKQKTYGQTALVTAARLRDWQPHAAAQVFMHQGVLGVLPICATDPDLKLLIWSADTEVAAKLLAANDIELGIAVASALELEAWRVAITGTRASFPLGRLLATTWVKPHLALVGDAAHQIHPLAGQGLNLGFADVATLTDMVTKATARGDAIGELRMLRRYQNIRLPQAAIMAGFIDVLSHANRQQGPLITTLRNQMLNLVNSSDSAKSAVMRLASGYIG